MIFIEAALTDRIGWDAEKQKFLLEAGKHFQILIVTIHIIMNQTSNSIDASESGAFPCDNNSKYIWICSRLAWRNIRQHRYRRKLHACLNLKDFKNELSVIVIIIHTKKSAGMLLQYSSSGLKSLPGDINKNSLIHWPAIALKCVRMNVQCQKIELHKSHPSTGADAAILKVIWIKLLITIYPVSVRNRLTYFCTHF